MFYRSIENHKASVMNQHAHLPLLSWWHVVGQIHLLGGVTRPDQFGMWIIMSSVTRTLQRHHLTCLDIYLSGSPGTHTCKYVSQIWVNLVCGHWEWNVNIIIIILLLYIIICIIRSLKCGWLVLQSKYLLMNNSLLSTNQGITQILNV